MVFFVFAFLIIVCSVVGAVVAANVEFSNGSRGGGLASGIVLGAGLLIFLIVSLAMSVHFVDNRNVGVVKTFGSITGQVGEGTQFTWPWQTLEEWNIRLQVIQPDTKCSNGTVKCMDAGSIDIQDVYIEGALNIEVDTRDVQSLARNIGKNYDNVIVRNRMYQVVKRVTAEYPADQILAKREEIRGKIREGLKTELEPYSINVTDFLLTNIDFSDGFRKSIDAKQKATQDALTAENVVKIKQAEANQAVVIAQGAADARRIAAQAEADANNLINSSLNGSILQLRLAQTLGDKTTIVPSNGNLFLNPQFTAPATK